MHPPNALTLRSSSTAGPAVFGLGLARIRGCPRSPGKNGRAGLLLVEATPAVFENLPDAPLQRFTNGLAWPHVCLVPALATSVRKLSTSRSSQNCSPGGATAQSGRGASPRNRNACPLQVFCSPGGATVKRRSPNRTVGPSGAAKKLKYIDNLPGPRPCAMYGRPSGAAKMTP